MADRKPIRKPVDADVASNSDRAGTVDSPKASAAQPDDARSPGQIGAQPLLDDEDTIEGDVILAAELDTETISAEDSLAHFGPMGTDDLASVDLGGVGFSGADAVGVDLGGLDLSEELANLQKATQPAPVPQSTPPLVAAVPVSAAAAVEVKSPVRDASAAQGAVTKKDSKAKKSPSQIVDAAETVIAAAELLPRKSWRDRLLMRSVPSWLISMMLHVAMLMALAAVQIEPVREAVGTLLTAKAGEEAGTTLDEEFNIRGPELEAPVAVADLEQPLSAPSEFSSQELELPDSSSLVSAMDNMSLDVGGVSNMVEGILPSSALNGATSRMSASLSGRLSGVMKSEMLERFGGNAASEKSVAMALKWLADHQDRSGGWTFGHSRLCRGQCKDDGDLLQSTNAATALALLPFLGAGQTHLEGNYQGTVHNGLKFLISRMKVTGGTTPTGSWHEAGGNMYSHGLASIVVCEAYAMTRDPDLLQPAQLALNFIVHAQDPRGGGWRYQPKQAGDTSVVGWQLMALKSGAMGNLVVPHDSFRKANAFLDSMSVNEGAYYGYDQPTSKIEGREATTAVGLLCRMYLGWSKDQPGLQEGVQYLSKRGPKIEDPYYSYYATQVLRQYGGPEWEQWNKAMRDGLISTQVKEGHAAGSWYSPHGHNLKGGRLYCTAMSAMILEVYYRHMPLYSDKSSDDEFEL